MRIRTELYFRVSELWIHRELRGQAFRLERTGVGIEIQFPPFLAGQTKRATQPLDISGWTGTKEDPERYVAVSRLLVVVHSEEAQISTLEGASVDAVSNHQQRCIQIATAVVTEFLDWLRVRGQYWLGVVGERPERCGELNSFDAATGEPFRVGFGGLMIIHARESVAMLTSTGLEEIQQELARSGTLPTPESFLADALHLREAEHLSDLQRAIVMAAMACEMKVQQVLREKTADCRKGLVFIILKNAREIEIAKIILFHTVMKEALGYSLHDSDKRLYDGVETLFRMRNRVVHKGRSYSAKEMREAIWAAKEVFQWLNAIPAGSMGAARTVGGGTPATAPRQ
jgi:hypothetical protein